MTTKMICAGYGGQGALLAGMIMAHAGMNQDKQVLWLSSYGGEMRGGSANCSLTISDDEIANPYISEMDLLMAMNQLSVEKFESKVKPGGYLIVNSSLVKEGHPFRKDIHVVMVDATNIAMDQENQRGTNMVMLGALAKWTGLFDPQYLCDAMEAYFTYKGKNNPRNAGCFWAGVERSHLMEGGAHS